MLSKKDKVFEESQYDLKFEADALTMSVDDVNYQNKITRDNTK